MLFVQSKKKLILKNEEGERGVLLHLKEKTVRIREA